MNPVDYEGRNGSGHCHSVAHGDFEVSSLLWPLYRRKVDWVLVYDDLLGRRVEGDVVVLWGHHVRLEELYILNREATHWVNFHVRIQHRPVVMLGSLNDVAPLDRVALGQYAVCHCGAVERVDRNSTDGNSSISWLVQPQGASKESMTVVSSNDVCSAIAAGKA